MYGALTTPTPPSQNTGEPQPVIAVEVVQPAALLHELDGARGVEPGRVAVQPLVLLPLAALKATLVGALRAPVVVVVHTLAGLRLTQAVT